MTRYYIKNNNKKYELIIHDSPGQNKYKDITENNLRHKDGVLFTYGISYEESFDDLNIGSLFIKVKIKKVVGLIIGNKYDGERTVNQEKVKNFQKNMD